MRTKRDVLRIFPILAASILICLIFTSCGSEKKKEKKVEKKIGITMNQTKQWKQDGEKLKKQLEALGFHVALDFSDEDTAVQTSAIHKYVEEKVSCIIVAPVDVTALTDSLEEAKNHGIPVISYEKLIKNTKAVNYYITFDDKGAGIAMGQKVEQQFQLAAASAKGQSYTIEFIMGDPNSKNDEVFYDGVMQVINPYLEAKTICCLSEQTEYGDCATKNTNKKEAKARLSGILDSKYSQKKPDIILAAGKKLGNAAKSLTPDSYIVSTLSKDHEILMNRAVKMIQNVADGYEPELNDMENYYNGAYIVPTYTCFEDVK